MENEKIDFEGQTTKMIGGKVYVDMVAVKARWEECQRKNEIINNLMALCLESDEKCKELLCIDEKEYTHNLAFGEGRFPQFDGRVSEIKALSAGSIQQCNNLIKLREFVKTKLKHKPELGNHAIIEKHTEGKVFLTIDPDQAMLPKIKCNCDRYDTFRLNWIKSDVDYIFAQLKPLDLELIGRVNDDVKQLLEDIRDLKDEK
jgi:hypothetical protein